MSIILALVPILALLIPAIVAQYPPCLARSQGPSGWWQQRNYDTVFSIYNTTIYPNNQAFLTEGVSALPPNLFSPNATGRITPIGNFSGLEDSVEYFFGLTPPVAPPLYDTWTSAQLAHFTSGCPEVAASVVYGGTTGVNSSFTATYNQTITTIKQIAFWRFDDQGRVMYYDAWLPSLESYTSLVFGAPSTNTTLQGATISSLCASTQELPTTAATSRPIIPAAADRLQCTGNNTQYSSVDDCETQMSQKLYGDWDQIWADNMICRTLHVRLAKLRPDVHCVHVGPTGGGKCVDIEYNQVYFDDEALFGSNDVFTCSGGSYGE